jgi:Leucine-rich repeat (LRR) protein
MDGMHSSPSCSQKLFPADSHSSRILSRRRFGGTIPVCLFNLPHLTILHLSANNLQGTLPGAMNLSTSLQIVILSNNQLKGIIPKIFVDHAFLYLDISFNRLNGKLDTPNYQNFTTIINYNSTTNLSHVAMDGYPTHNVSLQVNWLSGSIPSVYTKASIISILRGNIFQCSIDRHNLPLNDPEYHSYQCGSDYTN